MRLAQRQSGEIKTRNNVAKLVQEAQAYSSELLKVVLRHRHVTQDHRLIGGEFQSRI